MVYRHKIGLVKSFNKKLASTLATLLILASPIMSASSLLIPPVANAAPITDHIVINEIMADPVSGEIEWVELYNPTASSVNMDNWRIRQNSSGNFSGVFDSSAVIAPHSFLVREKTTSTALVNGGATLYLETGTNLADTDTVGYPALAEGDSYARTYDASTDFETRSGVAVTKNSTNGSAPSITASVNAEEFVATNGTYKGISVGFNVKDFNNVTAISVDMTRADGSHVTKNANSAALALASNTTTLTQLTAPFVIQDGSFSEASDTAYWQPAPATWNSTTRPTSVLISVTDSNGTKTVTNNTFNDGSPSWPTFESLLPITAATQIQQTVLPSDLAVAPDTWGYWIDKFGGIDINTPEATNTPNKYEITGNPVPTAGNNGAVKLTAGSGDKFNLATFKYANTKLTDIAALGYSSYSSTAGNSYLNIDVDFAYSGTPSYQGRLVWDPINNTPNQWNNHEAVASNGSWSWSQFDENGNVWPDGSTQSNRTWNDIVTAFPNAKISALLYLRTDGDTNNGATYFDNVYLATNTSNVKYNFELPEAFVNNPADSSFNYSEMYVRANNGSDESAIVRVPGQTDAVRFNFDGDTGFTDVAGLDHIQAGQWPDLTGHKQFRVKTPLPAGQYHVTAEYRVSGNWYPVTGDETAYSIDIPTATYTTPSATTHFFRVSDNTVRLRVEDQFKQFKYMVVEINANKFAVTREQCDLREEGNILFCDVKSATAQSISGVNYPAWVPLSEGTYTAKTSVITKANNRVDNLVSIPFTIDNTYPTLTNFKVITPKSVYSKNIPVSADATDANGIEYVKFFITAPKISDGTCDGNGVGGGIQYGVLNSGSTYLATFDTSGLNGDYCLNALSKDSATHTSNPILRMKVKIDNTAPVWALSPVHNSPLDNSNQPVGSNILMNWSDATDDNGVKYFYEVSSVSPDTTGDDNHFVNPFYLPFGPFTVSEMDATGTAPGTYFWHVKACDDAGNCTPWTSPWTGTVDQAPSTAIQQPSTPQPNSGTSNPPVITPVAFGTSAITQLGTVQNFGFQPAQITDGIVAAAPNTPQVLGASDSKDDSGDVLGDNASNFQKDSFNIMGIDWYYILAALAAIGGLWWILATRRRKQNDA